MTAEGLSPELTPCCLVTCDLSGLRGRFLHPHPPAPSQERSVQSGVPSSCLPKGPTLPWASHGAAEEGQSQVAERTSSQSACRGGVTAGPVTLASP